MRRLLAILLLAAFPAHAQEPEILRLVCHPDQAAMGAALAFSIDLAAKDAVETTAGQRFTVGGERDLILLSAPMASYRIDRLTGRFTRTDTQLRLEGACEKVGRKF